MEKNNKGLHKLVDVEVETVGLVTDGANQEEFFLLKSDELPEGQLEQVEEVKDMPNEQDVEKTDVEEVVETTEVAETPETESVVDASQDSLSKEDVGAVRRFLNLFKSEPEEAQEDVPADTDLKSEVEELRKAQDDLKTELAKAKEDAEKEREERANQEYVEKANSYKSLPIKADEFATHFRAIAKSAPESVEWFEALLRAVDNQLQESDIFKETGNSEITDEPDGILEKAQKLVNDGEADNLKDALLSTSVNEAEAYVQKRQTALSKGK